MGDPRGPVVSEPSFPMEYWLQTWDDNNVGWHYNFVHPSLLKHIKTVTGQNLTAEPMSDPVQFKENSKKTWFLPLSGKTVDISYLLSQGFKVFGVEGARKAIEELNKEQNLGMTYDEKESLYTGVDGRLKIYCGDMFTAPLEKFGPCDYVYDRAAFCALEYPLRGKYINAVKKALKNPDGTWYPFRYLLEAFVYDRTRFPGPPRAVDENDMQTYFESWANVDFLSSEDVPVDDHPQFKVVPDMQKFNRYYLMTPPQ